jgi:hypothetical protein
LKIKAKTIKNSYIVMKKVYLFSLLTSFALASCGGSTEESPINADVVGAATEITFTSNEYNFGDIVQGEVVEHEFEFTNSGSNDLIIGSAKPSCGCTVPDYPKKPLRPGEKGKIKVKFDSANKIGPQNKTVEISANTQPNVHTLYIKGNILGE